MENEGIELNKALTAFSDQTIYETHRQISNYIQNTPSSLFSFDTLFTKADPDLISGFEDILESSASEQVTSEISDEELFDLNEKISMKVMNWEESWKDVLNVALVKRILGNFQYTNKNISSNLLKSVYLGKHTEDLLYIWLSAFRKKLRSHSESI